MVMPKYSAAAFSPCDGQHKKELANNNKNVSGAAKSGFLFTPHPVCNLHTHLPGHPILGTIVAHHAAAATAMVAAHEERKLGIADHAPGAGAIRHPCTRASSLQHLVPLRIQWVGGSISIFHASLHVQQERERGRVWLRGRLATVRQRKRASRWRFGPFPWKKNVARARKRSEEQ